MKKRWWIIYFNCDCGSGHMAREKKNVHWKIGPIAPCGHQMGPMQFEIVDTIAADNPIEAMEKYNEIKNSN